MKPSLNHKNIELTHSTESKTGIPTTPSNDGPKPRATNSLPYLYHPPPPHTDNMVLSVIFTPLHISLGLPTPPPTTAPASNDSVAQPTPIPTTCNPIYTIKDSRARVTPTKQHRVPYISYFLTLRCVRVSVNPQLQTSSASHFCEFFRVSAIYVLAKKASK